MRGASLNVSDARQGRPTAADTSRRGPPHRRGRERNRRRLVGAEPLRVGEQGCEWPAVDERVEILLAHPGLAQQRQQVLGVGEAVRPCPQQRRSVPDVPLGYPCHDPIRQQAKPAGAKLEQPAKRCGEDLRQPGMRKTPYRRLPVGVEGKRVLPTKRAEHPGVPAPAPGAGRPPKGAAKAHGRNPRVREPSLDRADPATCLAPVGLRGGDGAVDEPRMVIELVAELHPADRHAEVSRPAQHGQLAGQVRGHEVEIEHRSRVRLVHQLRPVGQVDTAHPPIGAPEVSRDAMTIVEPALAPVPVVGGGAAEDAQGARGQAGSRLAKLRAERLPGVLAKRRIESGEGRRDLVIAGCWPSAQRSRARSGPFAL